MAFDLHFHGRPAPHRRGIRRRLHHVCKLAQHLLRPRHELIKPFDENDRSPQQDSSRRKVCLNRGARAANTLLHIPLELAKNEVLPRAQCGGLFARVDHRGRQVLCIALRASPIRTRNDREVPPIQRHRRVLHSPLHLHPNRFVHPVYVCFRERTEANAAIFVVDKMLPKFGLNHAVRTGRARDGAQRPRDEVVHITCVLVESRPVNAV